MQTGFRFLRLQKARNSPRIVILLAMTGFAVVFVTGTSAAATA
jgi:hypothetical protein